QVALRQTGLKRGHDGLCLLLTPAMYQPVVRIPTPRKFRVCPCHPQIERIVQEQIGQHGADHALNAKGSFGLRARRIEKLVIAGYRRSMVWRRGWSAE